MPPSPLSRRAIVGVAAVLPLVCRPAVAASDSLLRVMSFNVRLPLESDGANDWPRRAELFFDTIRRADPDIVGTQELFRDQGDAWIAALPRFAWFGIGRRGGRDDEHMGIFYRHDRLRLLDMGHFWLSDTPDVPGSIDWGHPYPRMVTWGRFEPMGSGRGFHLFNTHLPHRAEDEAASTQGAALIVRRISAVAGNGAVVLTGDFNTGPDSEAYRTLTARLPDTRVATSQGPEGTFHGFTGTPGKRIDWILARGLRVVRSATLTDARGRQYPSDHFPIVADLA
jgi:endonuclease/exonuclease/phosphatase family metal-dependent hydrolase